MAPRNSIFDRMVGRPNVSAVDIIGDPAVRDGGSSSQIGFKEADYSQWDEVMVGCGGTQSIAAAATANFVGKVSQPFKAEQIIIPSDVASSLVINSVKIGAFNMVDGDAIPADIYTEVSLASHVTWPTAQISQEITFNVTNIGAAAVVPRITLRGKRLR